MTELKEVPSTLFTFLVWVLEGKRSLDESADSQEEGKSLTLAYNIMYNVLSDRQINYETARKHRIRSIYPTKQAIGMGLAMRQYDRDNHVINLLSAPNFGMSITHKQC